MTYGFTSCQQRHYQVCLCIFFSQNSKIVEKDLDEIVNQLPTPFLLLGDFNGLKDKSYLI